MIVVACIPARYGSTRFPAKVLAKDTGKFLIQHTYERASAAELLQKVIIATDDERVLAAADSFGADCVMTSPDHKSGTDRIAEAVGGVEADVVVNIQADEPEIDPQSIDYVARLLIENPDYPMATLSADFERPEQIADPNIVKVVVSHRGAKDEGRGTRDDERSARGRIGRAIYFSRSPIPYDRDTAGIGPIGQYQRHLGIYAYRKDFLLKITALPQTPLEKTEKLEQLRAIENGYGILVGKVQHRCDGIDTPEQYAEFVKRYKETISQESAKKG